MSAQPEAHISVEEYLAKEDVAEERHEYHRGRIYAMAGGSADHALISMNAGASLHNALRPRGCRVYSSDMQVHIPAHGFYTYPDVSVVCGPPEFATANRRHLLNPTCLVEVLSPSTESYDRARKFFFYQTIPTLRDYLLISSERRQVEAFFEQDGRWVLENADYDAGTIHIHHLDLTLALDDLYHGTDLPGLTPLR
jgi:Uma2 family endonuclease